MTEYVKERVGYLQERLREEEEHCSQSCGCRLTEIVLYGKDCAKGCSVQDRIAALKRLIEKRKKYENSEN